MSTATRERPAAAKTDHTPELPEFVEEAQVVSFQTDVERQHTPFTQAEPALMLNPKASQVTLISAAQARMQMLAESVEAWLVVGESPDPMTEVLRPLHHLAQEVTMLLDAAVQMRLREGHHG